MNLSDAFTFQEKQNGSEADGLEMKSLRSRRRSVSPTSNHVRAEGGESEGDEGEEARPAGLSDGIAPDNGEAGASAIAQQPATGEGAAGESGRDGIPSSAPGGGK